MLTSSASPPARAGTSAADTRGRGRRRSGHCSGTGAGRPAVPHSSRPLPSTKVVPHFEYSVQVRGIFGGRTCGGFLPQRLLRFVSRHRAHSLKNALVMRLWELCPERSF
jgi:hypothetical protein